MPSTLIFDYPSVNAVTEYLTAQMLKSAAAAAAAAASAGADEEGEGAELALPDSPSAALAPAVSWEARQRALAVVAVTARPLMGERLAAAAALGAGGAGAHAQGLAGSAAAMDAIQRVPLERWDLDGAEAALGDPLTLSAQVRGFMQ